MTVLVIGGSGSGKSVYAEQYLAQWKDVKAKYYLATMRIFEEEGQKKVERHRKQRMGKGFLTLEQAEDIGAAAERIQERPAAVLLECMSNLTANEMFDNNCQNVDGTTNEKLAESNGKADAVIKRIMDGMHRLQAEVRHMVIVTNNVFEDGVCYESETTEYIRVLAAVNRELAKEADEVIEVSAGIPVVLKKGNSV